jgi:hypothetical protein
MAIGRDTSMKGRPAIQRRSTSMMMMMVIVITAIILPPVTTMAHVVLIDPVPRTNNDYLYTFDEGVCQATSCPAFCGDALSVTSNPLTVLQVVKGSSKTVEIRWRTNVLHEPYQYRIALSMGGDIAFDDNVLAVVDNVLANVDTSARTTPQTGVFATNITIPDSHLAACAGNETTTNTNPPCVLQLYDLYYFVSCANVVVQAANGTTTTPTTTMVESTTATGQGGVGANNNSGANTNNGAAATTAGNNGDPPSSSSSSCLTGLVTWIIIIITVALTVVASLSSTLAMFGV